MRPFGSFGAAGSSHWWRKNGVERAAGVEIARTFAMRGSKYGTAARSNTSSRVGTWTTSECNGVMPRRFKNVEAALRIMKVRCMPFGHLKPIRREVEQIPYMFEPYAK